MNRVAASATEVELLVGDWHVIPASGELRCGDRIVRVEPRAMGVLQHLAAKAGQVVSRDELLSTVWTGLAVTDDSLTQAVIKLRRALGEASKGSSYIETVPKRGYRLIAAVSSPSRDAKEDGSGFDGQLNPAFAATESRGQRRVVLLFAGLFLVIAVALGSWTLIDSQISDRIVSIESPVPDRVTIAVLPFSGPDSSEESAHFKFGLADELIGQLSRLNSLDVVSRASSFAVMNELSQPKKAAAELGATHWVDGSVVIDSSNIQLRVNLIDAKNGQQLWSERYSGSTSEVFSFQDEVIHQLVSAVSSVENLGARSLGEKGTENFAAYDSYLFGLGHLRRSRQLGGKSISEVATMAFERAIQLDPEFSEAYAGLAWVQWIKTSHLLDGGYKGAGVDQMWSNVEKSLEIRDNVLARRLSARRHLQLDSVYSFYRTPSDHLAAITELRKAIDIRPNDADALADLAHVLAYFGSLDESRRYIERAKELNPRFPPWYGVPAGIVAYLNGQYSAAVDDLVAAFDDDARQLYGYWYVAALAKAGEPDVALQAMEAVTGTWDFSRQSMPGQKNFGSVGPNTIYSIRRAMPLKDQSHMRQFLDGLRVIGVPEMPEPRT